MPPNLQEVKLKFSRRQSAKVMGTLAEKGLPKEGDRVQGIMVTNQKDGSTKVVAPEDLAKFTPLRLGSIRSRLNVPFAGSIDTLRLFLNEMFAGVTETTSAEDATDGSNGSEKERSTTTFCLQGEQVRAAHFQSSYAYVSRALIFLCAALSKRR
jgi:Pre-mRNA 3'-end-processing endonuclease polyadenylation factor C-term